ncbi:MAG: nucleoside deaminase [Campylobacterota bacterium]|nr:nucleoside deaminase [Campylobacterota bacterium]
MGKKQIQKDIKYMRYAIEISKIGIQNGQTPFGAIIVKDDKVISKTHNQVFSLTDITAHAEMIALKKACKNTNSIDLSGSTIYSTCEPCPMCFSAINWARIDRIVYGANIDDASNAGFNELTISNQQMKELGNSKVKIVKNILSQECQELFTLWNKNGDKKTY